MSHRPSPLRAILGVECFEDRICPTIGSDMVAPLFGGGAALASYVAVDSNFQAGFATIQNIIKSQTGADHIQHVIVDLRLIDTDVYGSGALAGVKAALSGAARGLIGASNPSTAALVDFVNAAHQSGFAAGALYALNQDLLAHAAPVFGTVQAVNPGAAQTIRDDYLRTLNDATSIAGSLNNLPNTTINRVIQDNARVTGAQSTALIPAEAVYSIVMTGATYSGTTNTLIPGVTQFPNSTALPFSRSGALVVYPTIDLTNVANNGLNPRDILINTGSVALAGVGVMNFTTNIALNLLNGGGFTQGAALDVATVTTDPGAGTIHIDVDPASLFEAGLNLLYRTNSILNPAFQIIRGSIDIQFSNGGANLSGTLALFAQSTSFILGTSAVAATFTGTRQ